MKEPCKVSDLPPIDFGTCYVLKVGRRFFCGFDRSGRVITAWSILGAVRRGCFYSSGDSIQQAIKLRGNRRNPRKGFTISRVSILEVGA